MNIPVPYKKISVEICRVLVGLLFVFSGFVKAVDPWGYTYKILDYLQAFGMSFFDIFAMPAAVFISGLEFLIGIALLAGVYRKFFSYVLLLFMSFMTLLTLYLAIADPVHDCGCFGDAIIITNWQTFYKNIVLLAATLVIFFWHSHMYPFFRSKKAKMWGTTVVCAFILGISLYCYLYLPVLDFRPYKIGNNIPKLMEIPENAPVDQYESTFVYSKDGVEQEFTIDNYPKTDDWVFVDRKDKLIKKGYEPAITDFEVYDEEGYDITDVLLQDENYSFWLVAWRLDKASDLNCDRINDLYDYCKQFGYNFYCLTSSTEDEINNWRRSTAAEYPFLNVDGITLKTIVRSNPGLVLVKDGTIINKWANHRIPGDKYLDIPLESSQLGIQPTNHDVRKVMLLTIALAALLSFVYFYDIHRRKKFIKRREQRKKKKGTLS